MIANLLLTSLLAASEPSDTLTIDSIPQAALVDTGRVMPSPRRPVGMGIQRNRDTPPPFLRPNSVSTAPSGSVVMALRFQDEWIGSRIGIGDGLDSGVTYLVGFDFHNGFDNLNSDTAFHYRRESKGFRFSLVREKCYPLFPKTTFLLDLGVAYKWQAIHVHSIRNTYTYSSKTVSSWSDSEWSKHFMFVLGLGTRLKISPTFSMSGGIQFEPDWTKTISHSTNVEHHTGSQFHLATPDWNLGLDWQFSFGQLPDVKITKGSESLFK
jgi:hypothetical protein